MPVKYKMLALDLDETLLNEESKVSTRNREAVKKALKKGILVTIATGRMFRSAQKFAHELGVELPLIIYHGAVIRRSDNGEIMRYRPVPWHLSLEIIQLAEEEKCHLNCYLDDRLFVKEENEQTRFYQQIVSVPVESVGDLGEFVSSDRKEPIKLSVVEEERDLEPLEIMLREKYGSKLSVVQSRPSFLEITSTEATKGQALRFLADKWNLDREDIIAIGDSYNDIDMLQYAGLGVAMANAPQKVRDSANMVTLSNREDGVAYFIEEYLL